MASRVRVTRTKTRTKKVTSGYAKCRNCGGDGVVRVRKSGKKK